MTTTVQPWIVRGDEPLPMPQVPAPQHVRAPIASGAERERQQQAADYYAALAASGDAPVSEKSLKKR